MVINLILLVVTFAGVALMGCGPGYGSCTQATTISSAGEVAAVGCTLWCSGFDKPRKYRAPDTSSDDGDRASCLANVPGDVDPTCTGLDLGVTAPLCEEDADEFGPSL